MDFSLRPCLRCSLFPTEYTSVLGELETTSFEFETSINSPGYQTIGNEVYNEPKLSGPGFISTDSNTSPEGWCGERRMTWMNNDLHYVHAFIYQPSIGAQAGLRHFRIKYRENLSDNWIELSNGQSPLFDGGYSGHYNDNSGIDNYIKIIVFD